MVTRLDLAYDREVHKVRTRIVAVAQRTWRGLGSYRDADFDRMIATLVPRIEAAQQQVSNLTDAYIRKQALAEFGTARDGAVFNASTRNLRGVDAETVYHRPFASTYTALSSGKAVQAAIADGERRLVDIVSSGVQLSKTHSAANALEKSKFTKFMRTLTGRENCAMCTIASTQRYHRGDLLPIHPGCVPGDSVISPVSSGSTKLSDFAWGEVRAVSRRLFKGELIEFVTASGNLVRVTPNHPVLTDNGWVPAGLLSEGDTVFRAGESQRVVGGSPDVDERPALAKDVFDAARMAFPLVSVPLASEDFHGDGAYGEVDVVYTNGNFPSPRDSELIQVSGESGLMVTHGGGLDFDGGGAFGPLFPSGLASLGGGVGGGGLGGDLFGGHFGCSHDSGFGVASDGNLVLGEQGSYRGSVHVESGGEFIFGNSMLDIEGNDLFGRNGLPSVDPATRFDAPAGEYSLENLRGYSERGRALVERLSGEVEGDRVVEFRRVEFVGHVYNLHTKEGWYSSNNHIVSNCDCGVKPFVVDPGDDYQIINESLLESVHDQIASKLGDSDRGARMLGTGKFDQSQISEYTDLILTREHGELGPTLTWRTDKFTGTTEIN